jgi:hypothetical protein
VGNNAYVADYNTGLQVIDVSNPTNCVRIGGYFTSGSAEGVTVVGNYAYGADGAVGLAIIEIAQKEPLITEKPQIAPDSVAWLPDGHFRFSIEGAVLFIGLMGFVRGVGRAGQVPGFRWSVMNLRYTSQSDGTVP